MIMVVNRLSKRGMKTRETMHLLFGKNARGAHQALKDALLGAGSVGGAAARFEVNVSTFTRWCVRAARDAGLPDPRSFISKRTPKTDFGRIVVEDPARAREVLERISRGRTTISVAGKLKVKPATIRRWRKQLGLAP